MDIEKSIRERRSIRVFKPDPVPKEILQDIMATALWAPSFGNNQPWEFVILGGRQLTDLRASITEAARRGTEPNPDMPWPDLKIEPYRQRRKKDGLSLVLARGDKPEDKEARDAWAVYSAGFFNAPIAIVVYSERALGGWGIYDCGLISMAIALLAQEKGLGTCFQAAPVGHTEIMRKFLNLPQNKLIIAGISIGYPDRDAPANGFTRSREPMTSLVNWML